MKFYRMLLKKPLRAFLRLSSDEFVGDEYIKCAHVANGLPSVVFENGFCSGMSCMKYWDSAFMELSKGHSLFAYDRVDEDLAKVEIEDIHTHLEDKIQVLRTLLARKGLLAPYVLVGHSLGGLYVQYFANKYPNEVAALVLVDAIYPEIYVEDLRKDIEENNILDRNIAKIGEVLLGLANFTKKPICILSATQVEYKKDNPNKVETIDKSLKKQKEYSKLYPFAKQIWVDSGHLIQYEKPDVIVDAVARFFDKG